MADGDHKETEYGSNSVLDLNQILCNNSYDRNLGPRNLCCHN